MISGKIPWLKKKAVIGEHNRCSPSSEIKITQYASSLAGVQEKFNEFASVNNLTGLPHYSGPDSRGRWAVSWREKRQAGHKNTAKFGSILFK